MPPSSLQVRGLFYPFQGVASFWEGILLAVVFGTLAIRWGISRGVFLARIKR
jgi:hypothetical protein